jgi:hypothetical protein
MWIKDEGARPHFDIGYENLERKLSSKMDREKWTSGMASLVIRLKSFT